MSSSLARILAVLLLGTTLACSAATAADTTVATIPNPIVDAPRANAKGEQVAVLAGGCFWGVEAVFQHVKGVTNVTAGYPAGRQRRLNTRSSARVKQDTPKPSELLTIHHRFHTDSFSKCSLPSHMIRRN
jgi:hypothetical protein